MLWNLHQGASNQAALVLSVIRLPWKTCACDVSFNYCVSYIIVHQPCRLDGLQDYKKGTEQDLDREIAQRYLRQHLKSSSSGSELNSRMNA